MKREFKDHHQSTAKSVGLKSSQISVSILFYFGLLFLSRRLTVVCRCLSVCRRIHVMSWVYFLLSFYHDLVLGNKERIG
jgi:hypothetical protein